MTRIIKKIGTKFLRIGILVSAAPTLVACAHVNLTQVAYEVLRQEDCRLNQLEQFCARTFAREYHEYERVRQEFIRSNEQSPWRTATNEVRITSINETEELQSKDISML